MTTRFVRLLSALLILTLLAAACGDDESGTDDGGENAGNGTDADSGSGTDDEGAAGSGGGETTAITAERCAANEAAGTITMVTGFDFAATAGIIDMIVADAEGYFDELCIDVDLQPGFAPANSALVIEGQAQIGNAGSFSEMVNNNVAGEGDLVAFLHFGRTAIEGLVLPEGSEITDFGDLCGSTVGIKGDLPYSLQASVAMAGIERSCFEEILLDGFDPVSHLELGIDALPVYKSNEPNTLEQQGIEFTLLDPLDFDVPSSFGITFTTQAFIDENPELMADITRALLKGHEASVADLDAAVDHAFELIDAAGNPVFLAEESERFRWGVESELIESLAPEGVGVAIPDTALLGEEIEAMVAAGVFETAPDWESMVDPSIAEGVYEGTALVWPG